MNKKGFTLVELLAVIAILAILATVATPIVLTVQKSIKNKMYAAKVKMIKESAILCVEKTNDVNKCNTVANLCTNEFLAKDKDCNGTNCSCQKNPITGNSLDNCNIDVFKDTSNGNRWKAGFPSDTEDEDDIPNCPAVEN